MQCSGNSELPGARFPGARSHERPAAIRRRRLDSTRRRRPLLITSGVSWWWGIAVVGWGRRLGCQKRVPDRQRLCPGLPDRRTPSTSPSVLHLLGLGVGYRGGGSGKARHSEGPLLRLPTPLPRPSHPLGLGVGYRGGGVLRWWVGEEG